MKPTHASSAYFLPATRTRQGGASIVEMIIVLPVLGLLLGGLFELSMLYRARSILDAATFEAAQQGALYNARTDRMRVGLAQGMAPHLIRSRSPQGVLAAYGRAELRIRTGGGGVRIISPTRDVFQQFRQRQTVQTSLDNRERGQDVLPNDNLLWRDAIVRQVRVAGQRVPMTVQDANLLKVESYWCERLLVPVFDRVIARTINWPLNNPPQCTAYAALNGGYYVLMRSSSVARMQSPAVLRDLPNG